MSFGSKVRPKTLGCNAMGSALLFMFRPRLLLYSAGSGVNRVQVVLFGLIMRLVCVDVIVMSSAYIITCTGAVGVGISAVWMLNRVGDRTPP